MLLESDVPPRRLTAQPCRRPSLPRRKWMASHGNRCARLRGRSARRAPRSSAARAARWSSRRCPSSKVPSCRPSLPIPARPSPPATGAGVLRRPGLPLLTPLRQPRAALSPPDPACPLPPHLPPFRRVPLHSWCSAGRDFAGVILCADGLAASAHR